MTDQLPNSTNSLEQIEIKDLSDYYPGGYPLRGVNLSLKKGQITCIIGDTCSGKSAVVKLLERRYDYSEGSIFVNGNELKKWNKEEWFSQLAVVRRNTRHPYKNVADNISQKACSAKEKANVEAFCNIYGFHHYITQLKKGYKTVIGDDPSSLTGAQSQLVALASALYPCPAILILNQSTTEMDFRMEQYVFDTLHRIKEHMIVLIITERPKIAYRSDYVYLLNDGQISKKGDPEAITNVLERLI